MLDRAIIARPPAQQDIASLIGAFTYALDLTEGQPAGHSLRSCYIANRIAAELHLSPADYADVHFATLLKDLGCSSNSARIHEIYAADDRAFKHDYKIIPTGLPATLQFVFAKAAQGQGLRKRLSAITNILKNGNDIARELIVTRCTCGSDIAADLGFGPGVCGGIFHLDEHWDGSGRPGALRGEASRWHRGWRCWRRLRTRSCKPVALMLHAARWPGALVSGSIQRWLLLS